MSNSVSTSAVDHFVPAHVSNDSVMLVGRILIAAIFLLSGLSKLAAPNYTVGYIASAGLPFRWLGCARKLKSRKSSAFGNGRQRLRQRNVSMKDNDR